MIELPEYFFSGNDSMGEEFLSAIDNRAFRYGDALFETIRVKNNNPMFLSEHLTRLISGMQTMKLGSNIEMDKLKKRIRFMAESKQNSIIRLTVFRKFGGNYRPQTSDAEYLISISDFKQDLFKNERSICDYHDFLKDNSPISSYKSGNSLIYVLASIFASEKNVDDAIIYNRKNRPCEATSSNLFVAKGRTIYTPPLSEAPVSGIIRNEILKHADKLRIYIIEKPITKNLLQIADEIFLTNSVSGVINVNEYSGKFFKAEKQLKISEWFDGL